MIEIIPVITICIAIYLGFIEAVPQDYVYLTFGNSLLTLGIVGLFVPKNKQEAGE